mmetsp:Transcript_1452/g.4311  ORF Transcript_1452/g.4311 Transcript_1452/m.4311 type:complete len:258 (-) Transcript_1452:1070-1843(-)
MNATSSESSATNVAFQGKGLMYILPNLVLLSSLPSCGTPSKYTSTPSNSSSAYLRQREISGSFSPWKCSTTRCLPNCETASCSSTSRSATSLPHAFRSSVLNMVCQMRCLTSLYTFQNGITLSGDASKSRTVSFTVMRPSIFLNRRRIAEMPASEKLMRIMTLTACVMLINTPMTVSESGATSFSEMRPKNTVTDVVTRPEMSITSACGFTKGVVNRLSAAKRMRTSSVSRDCATCFSNRNTTGSASSSFIIITQTL